MTEGLEIWVERAKRKLLRSQVVGARRAPALN